MKKIKKIIDWVVDQEKQSIDDYPALAKPLADKFDLDYKVAEQIMNSIIEWECDINTVYSLEDILLKKFPRL